jgi:predicted  nucleic acid-binding Zn-ribbon protein
MAWGGIILDDLASMLEAVRMANAELRIEAERASDLEAEVVRLQDEIDELRDEARRLRRSI